MYWNWLLISYYYTSDQTNNNISFSLQHCYCHIVMGDQLYNFKIMSISIMTFLLMRWSTSISKILIWLLITKNGIWRIWILTVRNFSFSLYFRTNIYILYIFNWYFYSTVVICWGYTDIYQQDDYDAHMLNYGQKVDEVSL